MASRILKLIIISGRSGSGKSTALHVLEDLEFNCIDNLPVGLLPVLVDKVLHTARDDELNVAVSIDARNLPEDLARFPDIILSLDRAGLDCEIVYLDARSPTLVRRFSETRRRHPLSGPGTGLREALEMEMELLESIANLADLTINTTDMSLEELRDLVRSRIVERRGSGLSLLFRSFGFKRGVPVDADLVFDARCLPNPYWTPHLRERTGLDTEVHEFFAGEQRVTQMLGDITGFLEQWLPCYEENNRSYTTVAIGCTGGQHRSVYLAERLGAHFSRTFDNVLVRHRDLGRAR